METEVSKNVLKKEIESLLKDDETLSVGSPNEIIYKIDNLNVYGGFDMGIRGNDHNLLINEDKQIGWKEIIEYGIVVVPETKTYISDEPIEEFEKLGYKNVPKNDNYIIKETEKPKKETESKDELTDRLEKLKAEHAKKEKVNKEKKNKEKSREI